MTEQPNNTKTCLLAKYLNFSKEETAPREPLLGLESQSKGPAGAAPTLGLLLAPSLSHGLLASGPRQAASCEARAALFAPMGLGLTPEEPECKYGKYFI